MIRIRDWQENFERDRTKQWKNLQWVPIPNKQGSGYRMIMSETNGLKIFACWISLVQVASQSSPRGDLSKYDIKKLSLLTMIKECDLKQSIKYLSEELDWIEVIEDLDTDVNDVDTDVKNNDSHGKPNCVSSSILFNSIQSNSIQSNSESLSEIDIAFNDYKDMRRKIKKPLTKKAEELAKKKLKELSGGDEQKAIKILEQSTMNSWQGLFELKQPNHKNNGFGRQEITHEDTMRILNMELE